MRFDILEAAISSLSAQRNSVLVDINSIMNTAEYKSNETSITDKMSSFLQRLSILDNAIATGEKLHTMFTNKINEQTAQQLKTLQNTLNPDNDNNS